MDERDRLDVLGEQLLTELKTMNEYVGQIPEILERLARIETVQSGHTSTLASHSEMHRSHSEVLAEHSAILAEHSADLTEIKQIVGGHAEAITELQLASHTHS